MAIAGRVAIVPKGDWSANATYKRLDAVTYNNTLYFAKKEVPAGTVTSNTEYWSKSIVGSVVTVDDALSPTSTNPVQNKVVTSNLTDLRKETTVNLLKPTLQTSTSNGITCTNNGDGTYTLNGTATKGIVLYIAGSPTKNTVGGYKLLGCPTNGSEDTYRIVVSYYENGEWRAEGYDIGNGVIIDGTYSRLNYLIKVESGTTVTNLVFKPMITTNLSATYDDFVPYTGDTGRLNGDVAELKAQSVKKDNVVNNQTTTVEGFALDARQANPNIDGSLAKQISDLNGSLNTISSKYFSVSFNVENDSIKNRIFSLQDSGFKCGVFLSNDSCKDNPQTISWYNIFWFGMSNEVVIIAGATWEQFLYYGICKNSEESRDKDIIWKKLSTN